MHEQLWKVVIDAMNSEQCWQKWYKKTNRFLTMLFVRCMWKSPMLGSSCSWRRPCGRQGEIWTTCPSLSSEISSRPAHRHSRAGDIGLQGVMGENGIGVLQRTRQYGQACCKIINSSSSWDFCFSWLIKNNHLIICDKMFNFHLIFPLPCITTKHSCLKSFLLKSPCDH